MTISQMKEQRAALLREAEALRVNGAFPTDEARAAFDAKMVEVDSLDAKIRTADIPAPVPVLTDAERAAVRDAAIAEERTRVAGIQTAVRATGLDEAVSQDLIAKGISLDAARAAIFEKLAQRSEAQPPFATQIRMGEDARDKWLRGAMNWIMVRSGMASLVAKHDNVSVDSLQPGEFRGLSLLDLARESLQRHGVDTRGMDRMNLAGQAMAYRTNYQTTSDFGVLLENALHKVLRAAYATQSDTWSRFCGTATVTDFRAHNWYRTGALSVLDALNEHGEYTNKAIPDGQKVTYSAGTKGNIIAITRQVIVNDDIGFVMRLISSLGRAGKLTIETDVYALLNQNSGLGPTQGDAQPLFHANRANVNATGSGITVPGLDADRAVMRAQRDPAGVEFLDLVPAVLLVATGRRGDALTINDAQFDPADNKFQKPNTVRGMFRDVIDTPRLTGNRRYLFADPATDPVFLVSFLEGQQEPVLETQDGWRTDGVEMKARLDFGVNVVDHRGAVTNVGQ